MTNLEHVTRILVQLEKPISRQERNRAFDPRDEVIQLRKVVLWLAERVDELEGKVKDLDSETGVFTRVYK